MAAFYFKAEPDGSMGFTSQKAKIALYEHLRGNVGKLYKIELQKPTRSNQQSRYYWNYLNIIEFETGNNSNDLHEYFKRELLPPVWKEVRYKKFRVPASTTKLSKTEFSDYLDKICALTGVPLPDPHDAGYLCSYPCSRCGNP